MPSSRAFAALLRKELVTAATNNLFVVLFGVPIILSVFLGLAFSDGAAAAAPVALILPTAPELRSIETDLREIPTIRVVGIYPDTESALAVAREGRAAAVVDLGQTRSGSGGLVGSIRITMDDRRPVPAEIVRSSIQAWLSQSARQETATIEVTLLRGVTPRDTTVPLWMLLSAVIVSMGSVLLLVTDEKEHKTLDALLVTPLGATAIVLAKLILGVATIITMSALIVLLNQTSVAQPLTFALGLGLGATGLVCLGLLIGTLAPNPAGAASFGSLAVPLLILPVLLAEAQNTPMIVAAQFLPTYHLNEIISVAVFGGEVVGLLWHFVYLLSFGVVSLTLAIKLLDRRA